MRASGAVRRMDVAFVAETQVVHEVAADIRRRGRPIVAEAVGIDTGETAIAV